MNWKIARDPQYKEIFEKYGEEETINSGFFYDTAKTNYDISSSIDIMCTPYHFLKNNDSKGVPVVLLTTGSFSPIHSGHIEMMTATKEHLEAKGYNVLGGYFAPDHDEYIKWKLKEEAIPFHYRMKYILDIVKDINWLTVDPWAGIFQPVAVNFTDIINRLKLYLEKHLGFSINVCFVCGEDNERFARTFKNSGMCAIAQRLSSDDSFSHKKESKNIFYISKKDNSSSTDVRKMLKWKHSNRDVILRIDDRWNEINLFDPDGREEWIKIMIAKRFNNIKICSISEQNIDAKFLKNVICLDPMIESGHKFLISRLYDAFGIKQLDYTNNPISPILSEQKKTIPAGNYFLLDDDVHTGGTMAIAKKILESSESEICIKGNIAFNFSKNNEEIIDARDFLYDYPMGGLVVKQSDNSEIRVPYVYPFVCPFIRASINDPMQFSIQVWEINMSYFKSMKKDKQYQKCKEFRDLLLSLQNG